MNWKSDHFSPEPRPGSTADGDGIEALHLRLSSLADRITASNGPKRGEHSLTLDEFLPTFLRVPEDDLRVPGAAGLDVDPQGRRWPQLPTPPVAVSAKPEPKPAPKPDPKALTDKIAELTAELEHRYAQIAELTHIQQTQTGDLQIACSQLERLGTSNAELRHLAAERDAQLAAANQKLTRAENENRALRLRVEAERQTSAEMSERLLNAEAELNDMSVQAASHADAIERLNADVAAAKAEGERLVGEAVEYGNRIHYDERKLLIAKFEKVVSDLLAKSAGDRHRIERTEKALAELAGCGDALSQKIIALEALRDHTGEVIHAQVGHIEFLETVAKVERDNAEATVRALIEEFRQECQRMQADEIASAEIRKNIVQLLPRLSARCGEPVDFAADALQSQVA